MYIMGGKRLMGFSPTEEYFAKSCFGISGVRAVPELEPGQKNDFLTRLFEEAKANLAHDMEVFAPQKDAYNQAMTGGKKLIEEAKDLDALTIAAATIKEMPHALTSKAELGAMLGDKAKALGGTWNKEENKYVKVSANSKPAK
jgi:hypothetical protein